MTLALAVDRSPAVGPIRTAIEELTRLLEDRPDDVSLLVLLGELYARAGDEAKAGGHFTTAADALYAAQDRRKAAAMFLAVLAIQPENEHAELQLAAIAVDEHRTPQACELLASIADRRSLSGNRRGEAELRIRIADLVPDDLDAQLAGGAARSRALSG